MHHRSTGTVQHGYGAFTHAQGSSPFLDTEAIARDKGIATFFGGEPSQ